jgi:hypothetical protein
MPGTLDRPVVGRARSANLSNMAVLPNEAHPNSGYHYGAANCFQAGPSRLHAAADRREAVLFDRTMTMRKL